MSEEAAAANVRLVRCPKCENLLPELTNYSVYQCGGCGAVLRANNRTVEADTISEKSDEERGLGASDNTLNKSDNSDISKKEMVTFRDESETDVKSHHSSSSRAENRGISSDTAENYGNASKIKADKWVFESNLEMNHGLDEFGHEENGKQFEELKKRTLNEPFGGSRRTRQGFDWRNGDRSEMERLSRNSNTDVNGVRYSALNYPEEGPSYGHRESVKNQNEPERFNNKVEYDEKERAELLRKIDELRDQLSQSCDGKDKPKGKVPVDRSMVYQDPYDGSEAWFPDGFVGSNRTHMQYPMPDRHVTGPRYINNYRDPSPLMYRNEMAMDNFYEPMRASNQGVMDPVRSQMLRGPRQAPATFQPQPSHPYFSGQYIDTDMDPYDMYSHNVHLHPPSCSCYHCYRKNRQVPARAPHPSAFANDMFPSVPNNPMFNPRENPGSLGPRDYNRRTINPPPLNYHNPQSHPSWQSDINSEAGGFVRRHPPPRVVLAASSSRRCRPIVGAAPFVACYNCFELLQLPRNFLLMERNHKRIRCGACSTVMLFQVVNKKLVVSTQTEVNLNPIKDDDSPDMVMNGGPRSYGHANRVGLSFSSDDYGNSEYDFQLMDKEPAPSSGGNGSSSTKPMEFKSLHSTTPSCSGDEDSPDSLLAPSNGTNSVEMPGKVNLSPPPAGSPLQEHFDYSTKYRAVNPSEKGSRSGRSDQEKMVPKKVTSRQNSMKEAYLATEISNEYSNTAVSHDSGDATREEDPLRANKGAEKSFFGGIIKKSFRDFSRSNQSVDNGKTNVTINGRPIPDRLLKKAEKLAGEIHPGHYWYDFRAGFWGTMGGPCLGIIPPFIEEFNYPMLESCAGGDTGVFVNGRELHQSDLELLGSRGLPTTRDRSYIIEISGRVLDEDSGEELDSLGKLAPTVERVKHGFGMKCPRAAT